MLKQERGITIIITFARIAELICMCTEPATHGLADVDIPVRISTTVVYTNSIHLLHIPVRAIGMGQEESIFMIPLWGFLLPSILIPPIM